MESLEYLMYVDEQEEKEKIYNSEMKETYKNGEIKGKLKKSKRNHKKCNQNGIYIRTNFWFS